MRTTATAFLAAALVAAAAHAEPIFETATPFGGFLGLNGFDVFEGQSVAARFIPASDAGLNTVSIWFMSNDFDGATQPSVTVSLRTNALGPNGLQSIPSDTILESWTINLAVVGWNPQLIAFTSTTRHHLSANEKYWVVAESPAPGGADPVWCWASVGNEYTANTDGPNAPWEGGPGAAAAMVIDAALACPADLGRAGGFTGPDGLLDNNDFVVFIDLFFATNPAADVGGPGGTHLRDGSWNNDDFVVFIDLFFSACPS